MTAIEATRDQEASGRGAALAIAATMVVFVVGMVVPVILGVLFWLTPDATLRAGDGGTFISASTSAGGFFASPVTSIQTSDGTIAVYGAFSGLRGQKLRIRDGIKSGLQLCVEGSTDACTDMAGPWTGRLVPVSHRRSMTDWVPGYVDDRILPLWFLVGFFVTIAVVIALARVGGWDNREGDAESGEPNKPSP